MYENQRESKAISSFTLNQIFVLFLKIKDLTQTPETHLYISEALFTTKPH